MAVFSEGEVMGGTQVVHRFDNGYGASVVRGPYSYGGSQGLFEVAVLVFSGKKSRICYDTPITNDVIGYLDEVDVDELLARIAAL